MFRGQTAAESLSGVLYEVAAVPISNRLCEGLPLRSVLPLGCELLSAVIARGYCLRSAFLALAVKAVMYCVYGSAVCLAARAGLESSRLL